MIPGEGFVLRPMEPKDAPSLTKNANNFKVWLNLKDLMPHPYKLGDAEWFINHVSEDDPVQKMGIMIEEQVAGVIGINLNTDIYVMNAHLGYWIGEPYWGKGYMSKAVKAFIPYIFDHFDIAKIESAAFSRNHASIRILEKNGFRLEGVLRKHAFKNGEYLDESRFGLLRNEL